MNRALSLRVAHFRLVAFVCAALWLATAARSATVRLHASSQSAWVGLPVTLSLEIRNANSHDAPQLPEVENADVQFLGQTHNRTSLSIINGRRTQSQTVAYGWTLTPRGPGPVRVPGFRVRVDGAPEDIAELTVNARVAEVGDRMALEITTRDAEVYVGQPLEITLELYIKAFTDPQYGYAFTANNLFSLIDMQASRWGPFAATLNDPAQRGQQITADAVQRPDAQGQLADYFRYRIQARVYPDRAGPLELEGDGVRIVGQYPVSLRLSRDFFGRDQVAMDQAQPIALAAANPKVAVRPVPTAGRPSTYRGAVGRYRITTAADPLSVAVGDAVTLQMLLLGDGPLDRLSAPPLEAIKALTDDFHVAPGPIAGVLRDGAKVFTTTIRPRRADVTAIPSIPLVSFDPDTQTFVANQSEPIALNVRPAERLSLDALTDVADPAAVVEPTPPAHPDTPAWLPLPGVAPTGPAWPWGWAALYAGVPAAAGLGRGAWWAWARLRRGERSRAARAAARARRGLKRARRPEHVAAALRRYAGDRSGRDPGALTAADARAALAACDVAPGAEALDAFATALRDAEAAACGVAPTPIADLIDRSRAALDRVAAAPRTTKNTRANLAAALLLMCMAAVSSTAQTAGQTPAAGDAPAARHHAAAERFEHMPPSAAALTNAATAWNLANQPARARAAALSGVRLDPASSAARAALADAEEQLGLAPAFTAGVDRLGARWLGWGGRRLLMAVGLAGLIGAIAWWWGGQTRLGHIPWIRAVRPWKIGGSLVVAAAGAGMAVHTALTVPPADTAVLLDADVSPRTGPGDDFPVQHNEAFAAQRGQLLRVIGTRHGWIRSADGWRPHDAVTPLNTDRATPQPSIDPPAAR